MNAQVHSKLMSTNENNKKVCYKCKKILPYSDFFKDKHNKKYGLSGYCKTCKVTYQRGLRNKNKPVKKPITGEPKENSNTNSKLINAQQHGPLKKGR